MSSTTLWANIDVLWPTLCAHPNWATRFGMSGWINRFQCGPAIGHHGQHPLALTNCGVAELARKLGNPFRPCKGHSPATARPTKPALSHNGDIDFFVHLEGAGGLIRRGRMSLGNFSLFHGSSPICIFIIIVWHRHRHLLLACFLHHDDIMMMSLGLVCLCLLRM